jgi:large subunit ribosomal protein L25
MSSLVFAVAEKKAGGTGASRELRRQGLLPIVAYYGQEKPHHFSLSFNEFFQEYSKGNILARVAELKHGGKTYKAIAKEVQTDPVSDRPIHVDFQLVKENEPIKVAISVKVLNKEKSPGLKKGGALNMINKKVKLICLPKNIPAFLEVDISGLEIGNNIHINDVKLPEGATPVLHDNFTILTIAGRVEEEKDEQANTAATEEATTTE